MARMGVGSAVTVGVDVSVAGRVAGVEEGLGVRETVLTGAGITGVAESGFGEAVFDGIAKGVTVGWMMETGSEAGGASPIWIMTQFPKSV
jgi:hypothetical protein